MVNRRNFMSSSSQAGLFLWIGRWGGGTPPKQPNILLVLADDLSWYDAGAYGNEDIHTPNIDKLAQEGMLFENAFTAASMCYPTRANLYTGVYPYRNGVVGQGGGHRCERDVADHLRALGYRVGLIGKDHYRPQSFDQPTTLDEYIKQDDAPFCLIYASDYPHAPWPAQYRTDLYNPDEVEIRDYMVDTPQTRLSLCQYYSECTKYDAELGELQQVLEDNGVDENTVVIATSEQGAAFPFAKWTCYDMGLKVQFIVKWPGVIESGARSSAMIEYIDVVPTLIDMAGGNPEAVDVGISGALDGGRGLDGTSFLPVLRGQKSEHKNYVYGVQRTTGILNGGRYPIRSARNSRYKYICNIEPDNKFTNNVTENANRFPYWPTWIEAAENEDERAIFLTHRYQHRPAEELYDILEDPFELDNLAEAPALEDVKIELRAKLIEWMDWQKDDELDAMLALLNHVDGG